MRTAKESTPETRPELLGFGSVRGLDRQVRVKRSVRAKVGEKPSTSPPPPPPLTP